MAGVGQHEITVTSNRSLVCATAKMAEAQDLGIALKNWTQRTLG